MITAVPMITGLPDPVAASTPPVPASAPHVLVIGVDGLVWDRVADAQAPTLQRLANEGTLGQSLLYAPPYAATSSGPGWATLLTGTWPDQHGVVDNGFGGSRVDRHPDLLTRAERDEPGLDTWAGISWTPIRDELLTDELDRIAVVDGDDLGYRAADRQLTGIAAEHLQVGAADLSYLYLGQLDVVGHARGSASIAYLREIERVDAYVEQLLDAIEDRPGKADEDWLVLLGTDHGHLRSGGHGGSSRLERGTFVLAWGDGVPGGPVATSRLVDLAPTALEHLGVPLDRDLAGRALRHADADPFEAQRAFLRRAVDEDLPRDLLGWTRDLPRGWSQDRAALPAGGVREWSGWTLTTDAFWTSAAPDQERESFVRGRGVIAVADSDEWADAAGSEGERFDATLWTPSRRVRDGASEVVVAATHVHRQDGDSVGEVLLRVDGGDPIVVARLEGESDGTRERWVAPIPAGATGVEIGFRYAGTNAWYWALDDVAVRTRPAAAP